MSGGVGSGWDAVEDDDDFDPTFRKKSPFKPCTFISSRWCPNCGVCRCTVMKANGHRDWDASMNHADCPLHKPGSRHPFTSHFRRIIKRPRPV